MHSFYFFKSAVVMAQQENSCFPWLIHCNLQLTHRSHWCWCRVNSLPTLTPRGILWKSPSLSHRRVKILCFTVLAALWPLKQPVQMNTAAVKRESVLRAPLQLAAAYGQMQMDLIVAVSINSAHALTSVTLTLCYYNEACHMTDTQRRKAQSHAFR